MTTPDGAGGAGGAGRSAGKGAGAGDGGAALGAAAGRASPPSCRRRRMRIGPLLKSIAVRSYRFIRRTRWWIVRTSSGSEGLSGIRGLRGSRRQAKRSGGGSVGDGLERLGDVGQDLAAVGGHQHVV